MNRCIVLLSLIFLTACKISERNSEGKQVQKIVCSLSSYEREALSLFFRFLLEEESCGYSLYGEKPLSVQEFFKDELPLALNVNLIKKCSLLKEGMRIWENSGLALLNSRYIITASKSSNSDGWVDILFINKQSFLNAIDINLPLFQYVLGPKVTPLTLLNQFSDPNQNLSSIFHEDRVLIGIILGYGIQNALHGSRLEYLHEHLHREPLDSAHPGRAPISSIQSNSPSFGFSNTLNEADRFKNEMFTTTNKGKKLPRLPWFAAIKHEETDRLLASYQITQKKIRDVLASPNFLEEVFVQFFSHRVVLPCSDNSFEELLSEKLKKEENISILIGRSIQSSLRKENATTQEIKSFIRGMLDSSGEREDLGLLLREYDVDFVNSGSNREGKDRLLYRLGQKIGDQYRPIKSIAPIEEIAAYIEGFQNSEIDQQNQSEIIAQVNLLGALKK